jgi:UDP-GlcNAc:undecaprenyl-phosphate/decaprenyl-phosphate GlcNAc-1-phosphate transferase
MFSAIKTIPFPLTVFITALFFNLVIMPVIIRILKNHRLFDFPNFRKVHKNPIPTLGGIGIFLSMLIVVVTRPSLFTFDMLVVITSASVLFVVGIIDDLKDIRPRIKLYIQILITLLPVVYGIRIDSLNDLGIGDISYPVSIVLSTVCIVFFINAFNLIDGVDGLAGGLAIITLVAFALLFYFAGVYDYALLAAAIAGSCLGFLVFNFNPAKIFMGDSGSLTIGFFISIFAVRSIQLPSAIYYESFRIDSFLVVFALVFLPSLDAVRVFSSRLFKKESPFKPDKTHIHHLMLDTGMTHKSVAITLYTIQIIIISLAFFPPPLIVMEIMLGLIIALIIFYEIQKFYRIVQFKNKLNNMHDHRLN